MNPEETLLSHLDLIERAARHACRRYGLSPQEVEDFTSQVKVKLMDDDYAVLRKFKGRSTVATYLTTVINNQLRDYLDHRWGKWRPSAEAKRLGKVAMDLDRLLTRDGHTFDEACHILQTNHRVELSWQELAAMAERLPARWPRRVEGDEPLARMRAPEAGPERHVLDSERRQRLADVHEALMRALAALPAEDRLLVRMQTEHTVAQIARTLQLEQKPLYRRIRKILAGLRRRLEAQGLRREDVREILTDDDEEGL